jgi:hypothetical protein
MLAAWHIYVRVQRCGSPESRCIGGQFSLCRSEFDGPYCSQCAPNHYSQGFLCLPCVEGSAQKRTIIIVSFIIIFNSMLLFANYEVSVTLLGVSSTALHTQRCSPVRLPLLTPAPALQYVCMRQVVSTLQCFRGIGMYVSQVCTYSFPDQTLRLAMKASDSCLYPRDVRRGDASCISHDSRLEHAINDCAAGWVPLGYLQRYRCCNSITVVRVSLGHEPLLTGFSARLNL